MNNLFNNFLQPSISGKSDTDDTDTIFQYLVSNENEPTNIEQGNEQRKPKLLLLSIADMVRDLFPS